MWNDKNIIEFLNEVSKAALEHRDSSRNLFDMIKELSRKFDDYMIYHNSLKKFIDGKMADEIAGIGSTEVKEENN